jgi:hypothetical protein
LPDAASSASAASPPPKQAPLPADVAPEPAAAPPARRAAAKPPPLPRLLASPDRPPLPLSDAIKALKASKRARFVESVEMTVRLGIDPKRSDQMVRTRVHVACDAFARETLGF